MRFAIPLVILLALANCSGTPPTPEELRTNIANVCGILIPVADLSVLLTQANPAASGIDAWVKLICSAYQQQKAIVAAAQPEQTIVVNGVTLHYEIKP